jgi:ABC-type sugar transport system substrate-binding protein
MITMFAARLVSVLAVLAPVALALQSTQAAAQAQLAPVQRVPTYAEQQKKINAWTVGLAAGLIEGAPSRPAVEMARVVDDGTNLLVLPIVRLGTTERLLICAAPIWR